MDILKKIAEILNKLDCTWAIGSSMMLKFNGLVKNPRDIDILIEAKDSQKIKKAMDNIGQRLDLPSKDPFRTKEFFGYNIDGVEVEFMGDFSIELENKSIYKFILDEKSIKYLTNLDKVVIPTTTLEDWFVAYLVMGDPKGRVPIIKKYLVKNGIKHEELLKRNLEQDLPNDIRNEIIELLNINK